MTTYHVWLTGQEEPETVRADEVYVGHGLLFYDLNLDGSRTVRRYLEADNWRKWAVVHDDTDHRI